MPIDSEASIRSGPQDTRFTLPDRLRRLPFSARAFLERVRSPSIFDARYYRESQNSRLLNLFAHVDLERWRGLKILEVGAGRGHLGQAFSRLGFDVTSTDGRPEHVDGMRDRGLQSFVLDLDRTPIDQAGQFDVILAFGVLYHLAHPEEFLQSCGRAAKVLLLETSVCDRVAPVIEWVNEPGGWRGPDQAIRGRGCRPSPSWIEGLCRDAGFNVVRDISNSLGDWSNGTFGWDRLDDGKWSRDGVNLRKMWVCEKEA